MAEAHNFLFMFKQINPGGMTARYSLAEHCQQTAEQLVQSMNGDQKYVCIVNGACETCEEVFWLDVFLWCIGLVFFRCLLGPSYLYS